MTNSRKWTSHVGSVATSVISGSGSALITKEGDPAGAESRPCREHQDRGDALGSVGEVPHLVRVHVAAEDLVLAVGEPLYWGALNCLLSAVCSVHSLASISLPDTAAMTYSPPLDGITSVLRSP